MSLSAAIIVVASCTLPPDSADDNDIDNNSEHTKAVERASQAALPPASPFPQWKRRHWAQDRVDVDSTDSDADEAVEETTSLMDGDDEARGEPANK
eukprot:COSAG05_NODE_5137_length_1255_cov_1.137543_2_plen_96_part_00